MRIKSNGIVRDLVEASKFDAEAYSGINTYVRRRADWVKITVNNTDINLAGGQAWGKIGELPFGCTHPDEYIGLYPLMTKAWLPTTTNLYIKVENNVLYARSAVEAVGILYFEWITDQLKIGGGYKNPTILFKKICTCISKLTQKEGRLALCL